MHFSNHIDISSVLVIILNYIFHDLQGPCQLSITYEKGHQGHIEETQAQNQLLLYIA